MIIRRLKAEDAKAMLGWMHDENVVEFMKANFMEKTLSDCEAFIEDSQEDKNNLHLAVADSDDSYLGTVSLKNIDTENRRAEFAIAMSRKAIGTGVAGEAMAEIIRIAFDELNLDSVYWNVMPENKRAVRFYDKNGYQRVPEEILAGGGIPADSSYLWYQVSR